MKKDNWRLWDNHHAYGELLYKRAIGELEEMESSKALCQILARFYVKEMRLADIGCGAGHYLRSLRQRLDHNINYTGVDATKYYLSLAKKAFPANAEFKLGDIFNIPLADNAFDIVMSNNVLLHLPPFPNKAIAELMRISKKYVVIRTVFGERDYIVQELRYNDELSSDNTNSNEYDEIAKTGEMRNFNYFNMYTEQYFRHAINAINPTAKVEIINDDMWNEYDNTKLTTTTGTKVVGNTQVSGNLILDWKFIVITKD